MRAPLPDNEDARLEALRSLSILDSETESDYDEITKLAAKLCDAPISAVTLIDANRQWFKSIYGLDVREINRDDSYCSHTIMQKDLMVIEDTSQDERFFDSNLNIDGSPIRFYAGATLSPVAGQSVGALCVIDIKPRKLSPLQEEALRVLSRSVERLMTMNKTIHSLTDQKLESAARLELNLLGQRLQKEGLLTLADKIRDKVHKLVDNLGTIEKEDDTKNRRSLISRLKNRIEGETLELTDTLKALDSDISTPVLIETVYINEVIGSAVATVTMSAALKSIPILEIRSDADPVLQADAAALTAVVTKILDNAIEYSDYGAEAIEVSWQRVNEDEITLEIRDSGRGMPSTLSPRDKYVQGAGFGYAPASSAAKLSGIEFCRAVIASHNGTMWFNENSPHGTVVNISLPVKFQSIRVEAK